MAKANPMSFQLAGAGKDQNEKASHGHFDVLPPSMS